MNKDNSNSVVQRGIALHKMIRLLTIALGGDVLYFNFRLIWPSWEMSSAILSGSTSQEKGMDGVINIVLEGGIWLMIKTSNSIFYL